jgi:hypothetical protein
MGRAGGLAGRGAEFADGKGPGNGLRIFFIDSLAGGKALVLFVGNLDGANLGAFAAARAFGKVHIPGFLADFCPEMPWFTLKRQYFRSGFQLNI